MWVVGMAIPRVSSPERNGEISYSEYELRLKVGFREFTYLRVHKAQRESVHSTGPAGTSTRCALTLLCSFERTSTFRVAVYLKKIGVHYGAEHT